MLAIVLSPRSRFTTFSNPNSFGEVLLGNCVASASLYNDGPPSSANNSFQFLCVSFLRFVSRFLSGPKPCPASWLAIFKSKPCRKSSNICLGGPTCRCLLNLNGAPTQIWVEEPRTTNKKNCFVCFQSGAFFPPYLQYFGATTCKFLNFEIDYLVCTICGFSCVTVLSNFTISFMIFQMFPWY